MRNKLVYILFVAFILSSCERDVVPVEIFKIREISFKEDLQPLLASNCAKPGCHTYFEAAGKLDLERYTYLDLTQEKSNHFPNFYRVVPYDLDSSVVVQKLEHNPKFGVGMPATLIGATITGVALPAGDSTLLFMKGWIMQGAKNN